MSYKYIGVPKTISSKDCAENGYVFAPSKYSRFIPNDNVLFVPLSQVCKESKTKTDVKRGEIYHYSEIGDIDVSTGTISSTSLYGLHLPSENPKSIQRNDILVSTVRSYRGGFGLIDSNADNMCCSPAILVIRSVDNNISKEYLLAFLRADFTIEQIFGFQTRGMYPRLDGDAMDKLLIPIPKDKKIIRYVSDLMRSYLNKNELIKQRHAEILRLIEEELQNNQKPNTFEYHLPTLKDLKEVGRLDASLYKQFYKQKLFLITNYINGSTPLTEQELTLIPGPSLELKLLGTRIDSDVYRKGFYRLITPTQITNYGTVKFEQYIGTPAKITKIQYGDILFGESGTGRTLVYLDDDGISINNAHAHVLRSQKQDDLSRIITIRSILQYYKEAGITDCLTVGGSGGHLSPSYFNRLLIPNFPDSKQKEIAALYHNPIEYNTGEFTLDNFTEKDNTYNAEAGIYELDKTAKHLQELLNEAIDMIVNDQEVEIKF